MPVGRLKIWNATTGAWEYPPGGTASGGGSQPAGVVAPVRVVCGNNTEVVATPPNGAANIDGFQVVDGDRVLLAAQTVTADRGVWIVNTAGDWTRPTDWADGATIPNGLLIPVGSDGSNLYSSIWTAQATAVVGANPGPPFAMIAGITMFLTDTSAAGFEPVVSPFHLAAGFLPSIDPHVVGDVWNNGGVLTVSAG